MSSLSVGLHPFNEPFARGARPHLTKTMQVTAAMTEEWRRRILEDGVAQYHLATATTTHADLQK